VTAMHVTVGPGWRPLCDELAEALGSLDPPGELLEASIDATGLPRFRVRLDPRANAEGRTLVRRYESRAVEVCESCGRAGRVRAGAVVTIICDDCV
jgi:hypothetical protein